MNFSKVIMVTCVLYTHFSVAQTKEDLFNALKNFRWDAVIRFISTNPALVNEKDDKGDTALHYAVDFKQKDLIKFLLDKGADYTIKNNAGESPFDIALKGVKQEKSYVDIAKLLVAKAPPKSSLEDKLAHYFKYGNWDAIKNLIAEHPDLIQVTTSEGDTPLHFAAEKSEDLTKFLLDNGADVNSKNKYGETPLFEVVDQKIAEMLLAKGAEINKEGRDGETPLFNAVYRGNKELVKILLDHGAQVNVQKKNNGETPLHMVIRQMPPGFDLSPQKTKDFEKVVKLLLEHGADLTIPSKSGKTPLELAQELKEINVITLIDNYNKSVADLANNLAELTVEMSILASRL